MSKDCRREEAPNREGQISFKDYYKEQLKLTESELDELVSAFERALPQAFRVNTSCPHSGAFEASILSAAEATSEPPHRMDWYRSSGKAYCFPEADRGKIKRNDAWKDTKKKMVNADHWGAITRQEFVSMVPPTMLDVQPHHRVLDMCASPGSKTNQIMELLTSRQKDHESRRLIFPDEKSVTVGSLVPSGCLVGNDVEAKRVNMLIHQINRCPSPIYGVQMSDASRFMGHSGTFDRILCDVPCCGDGTLRKNMDIWKKWTPKSSFALNTIQSGILRRGLSLLKTGGRLVYSTCSLNPLQDEAVLYHILKESKGTVELIDIRNEPAAQGLKMSPGITEWKVPSLDGTEFVTSIPEKKEGEKYELSPTLFPGDDETVNAQLCRSARFLPQDNNSGGFFVAILVKNGDVPWGHKFRHGEKKKEEEKKEEKDEKKEEKEEKKKEKTKKESGFNANPTGPFDSLSPQDVDSIRNFYGMFPDSDSKIPVDASANVTEESSRLDGAKEDRGDLRNEICLEKEAEELMFVVKENGPNKAYMVSREMFNLCSGSVGRLNSSFCHLGTLAFQSFEANTPMRCHWRVSQNGVQYLLPKMKRRVIFVSVQAASALLSGSGYLFKADLLHLEMEGGVSNLDSVRARTSPEGPALLESGGCIAVVVPPRFLPWVERCPSKYGVDNDTNFRKDIWTTSREGDETYGFKMKPNLPKGWNMGDDTTEIFGSLPAFACLITRNGHLQGYCPRVNCNAIMAQFIEGAPHPDRGVKRNREEATNKGD